MARLLIIDDDLKFLDVLSKLLATRGHVVDTHDNGTAALESLAAGLPDVLICDINMTPVGGLQVLQTVRAQHPKLPVIMMTAYGTVDSALECLRMGAFDYITKPFRVNDFADTITRAIAWDPDHAAESVQPIIPYHMGEIVAESVSMQDVCTMIERVAPTEATMLFRGERSVGKQLCGRTIHALSPRREGPFVVADCARVRAAELAAMLFGSAQGGETAPGLLQQAAGGTLWITEIGILPLSVQERLLRVFKEEVAVPEGADKPVAVDARILAETAMDIERAVGQGRFRADLFARFAPIAVEIKPLRERREDIIPLLWHCFRQKLGDHAPLPRIEPDARGMLLHYPWPGNMQELSRVADHLLQAGAATRVTRAHLPETIMQALSGLPIETLVPDDSGRAKALKAFLMSQDAGILETVGVESSAGGSGA